MQQDTLTNYTALLSEVIKKHIVILGPDITLLKARSVPGLTVSDDGTVTAISGNFQEIGQKLIDQFMELSGQIVKQTMEPLLHHMTPPTPSNQPAIPSTPMQQP